MEEKKTERLRGWVAEDVSRAADLLRAGGIVAFPTETVYGLGANALDPAAVARIFAAKERPGWDPLIVHVSDRAMLERVTVLTEAGAPLRRQEPPNLQEQLHRQERLERQDRLDRLITTFWPGPLTLLLPRSAQIPDAVTAGRPLVGVRMPRHPIAMELIRAAGVPVAAPSANRFGRTSPTTAAHVLQDLDGRIDAVLDGGPTSVGLESTVLDPAPSPMVIYRPGAVTVEIVEAVCGAGSVQGYAAASAQQTPASLPSPGVGIRHYAPRARLVLVEGGQQAITAAIHEAGALPVGVMLPQGWSVAEHALRYPWGPWDDPEELARRLFAGLHALDAMNVEVILCPMPRLAGLGLAMRDRLEKAARLR